MVGGAGKTQILRLRCASLRLKGPATIRAISLSILLFTAITSTFAQSPEAYRLSGDVAGAHDPSIIRQGDRWYVFTTGKTRDGGLLGIRCSSDAHEWRLCGHVFDTMPAWIAQRSPGTHDLWAPDITFANGVYRLYYCYSLFGKNASGIALATNKTLDPASPDYRWVDEGLVLQSRAGDDFNAIDPAWVADEQGHGWLTFGSFWSGIQLVRLDDATGKLPTPVTGVMVYPLARRSKEDGHAVEAPSILHHDGWFYLFTSWDACCRGAKSTYRTVVGRSRRIAGPYLDRSGKPLLEGGGTELLTGNARWAGPGGETAYATATGDLLVFHAYDATTGKPYLQISPIDWVDGWPKVALGAP
ncbi:family 43 glycosylhydrolase [Granulicella rosea]|nr:family 43 glycosylhydrolase [Granulicella rosea]